MKKAISMFFFLALAFLGLKAEILPISNLEKISNQNRIDTSSYPLNVYTSIDFAYFANKPINIFLAHLDNIAPGYLISPIYSQGDIRRASRINIYYANNIAFVITVKDFQFLDPISIDRNWDIVLFRKENIYTIDLYQVGTLLYGIGD